MSESALTSTVFPVFRKVSKAFLTCPRLLMNYCVAVTAKVTFEKSLGKIFFEFLPRLKRSQKPTPVKSVVKVTSKESIRGQSSGVVHGERLDAEGRSAAEPRARDFEFRILNFELLKSEYFKI